MIQIASLIVVNLLIAAFIGFLIGFIIGKNSSKKYINKPKKIVPTNIMDGYIEEKEGKPFRLDESQVENKDNLRKIKGIDNIIEKELNSLGIFYFKQIASWSDKNCQWIEEKLNLSGLTKELKWTEQAKILQTGKETLFSQKIK